MDYSKLSDATLKALKNKQPLDYSKLSDDEVRELSKIQKPSTQIKEEPISKLESGVRGAAQGASFGFSDELTGAIESLLTDKSYEQARDESRAAYKAAEEENPLTYLGGSLAGGLAVPVPFGGAKTIAQTIKTGAGYGALAGLGAGEADLTKGELDQAALESLTGAGIGAGVGGAFAGLAKTGGLIGKTDAARAFKEGKAGNLLVGKEARQKLGDELVEFAGKTGQEIQDELSQQAIQKGQILSGAEQSGQKIDMTDLLNVIYPEELSKVQKSFSPEGDSARKALETRINRAKGKSDEPDELMTLLNETYGGLPDVEKTIEKIEMSPTDVDAFRRALGRLGFEADLKDDQIVALAKRLSGKTGEKLNTEVSGLGDVNKNIQNLIEAQDIFNIGEGLDELGNQVKLTPLLQRLDRDSLSSDVARSRFDKGISSLKEASPELGSKIEKQGTDLAERYTLARDINQPISLTGNPFEMAKRISGKASNLAGIGANKIAGSVPGQMASKMYSAAPETINDLAARLEAKGSKFGTILRNLANEPEPKRKALMFALMQQPAFREVIDSEE